MIPLELELQEWPHLIFEYLLYTHYSVIGKCTYRFVCMLAKFDLHQHDNNSKLGAKIEFHATAPLMKAARAVYVNFHIEAIRK